MGDTRSTLFELYFGLVTLDFNLTWDLLVLTMGLVGRGLGLANLDVLIVR